RDDRDRARRRARAVESPDHDARAGVQRIARRSQSALVDRPAHQMMPSIFLAHGSPFLLDDQGWVGELKAWADALSRPTAILMLSAHLEERPLTLGATTNLSLVYDFYGFPAKYYSVRYAAPGAPELARRVRALV